MIRVSAPGKLILFGEHAVVYGEAAIATAVDKRAFVTACELDENKIIVESKNLGNAIESTLKEETSDPIVKAAQVALETLGKKVGIGIEINSEIPVGVGMGSSASVVTATAAAVLGLFSGIIDPTEVAQIAFEAEKIAHGKPSGIDNAITTFGGTIHFKKGTIEVLENKELEIVVGNTGTRRNTRAIVEGVRKYIEDPRMATHLYKISSITNRAKKALLQNDLVELGKLMDENHKCLRDLGVSSKELEKLVQTAKGAGALGAKLTGAGGGGCMIAIAENPEKVIEALEAAGASAFLVRTNQKGVEIEKE